MAVQDLIYIDFPNNPRHGDSFSYRINKNGVPVTYTGSSNTSVVSKTYIDHQVVTVNNIVQVDQDDSIQTAGGIDFGSGFQLTGTSNPSRVSTVLKTTLLGNTVYYVGGQFNSYKGQSCKNFVRLNADGSLDTSFTTNIANTFGITSNSTGGQVTDVAIQSDGKIVAIGNFYDINGSSSANTMSGIVRLNTNGTIDNKFGGGFYSQTSSSSLFGGVANKVLIQSDGKIIVGGFFNRVKQTSTLAQKFALVRYTTSGVIDSTFTNDVRTTTATNIYQDPFINDMEFDSTETSVFVGGLFSFVGTTSRTGLAKLTLSNSALNTTFNPVLNINGSLTSRVQTMYRNGSTLYIGGDFNRANGLVRYAICAANESTGGIVSTFNPQFTNSNGVNANINKVFVDSTGRILVGGYFDQINGNSAYRLGRVTSSGGYDNTYIYSVTPSIQQYPILDIIEDGSTYLISGVFTTYEGGAPTFSPTNIPIGSTIQVTANNTVQSLQYFNSAPSVSYEELTARVTVKLDINGETITVDSLSDTDNYVVLTLTNAALGIPPIVVQTRSPHILTIPFSGAVNNVKIDLKMFRGSYVTDIPVTPTYTLRKQKIKSNQNIFYVDLSYLCRDFLNTDIDSYLNQDMTMQPIGENESVWVRMDAQLYSGSTTGSTVGSGTSVQYIAIDGYGYTEEGVNPQPPKVLMTNSDYDIHRGSDFRIYVNINSLTNITYYTDTETVSIPVSGSTAENDEYFSSIKVNTNIGDNTKITYVFTYDNDMVVTKTFNMLDECTYDVKDLYFKNKYGFLQTISMLKRSDRKYDIDRETYNRSILTDSGTFDPRNGSNVTYLVNSNEELTLNSGYINEYMNAAFKELMLSDEIYINDNGVVRPCHIIDSSWNEQLTVNERLINYVVKVRISNGTINNIR